VTSVARASRGRLGVGVELRGSERADQARVQQLVQLGVDRPSCHDLQTLVLGSKSVTIGGGSSQTLTITLNGVGRRLLVLHHVLAAKLTVIFNAKPVSVYSITFRAPPHHKK
jgi:hypothetical protein